MSSFIHTLSVPSTLCRQTRQTTAPEPKEFSTLLEKQVSMAVPEEEPILMETQAQGAQWVPRQGGGGSMPGRLPGRGDISSGKGGGDSWTVRGEPEL